MKHGNFKGFVCMELANQSMMISACAKAIREHERKLKWLNKVDKWLVMASTGMFILLIDTRKKYARLLKRVQDIESGEFFANSSKNEGTEENETEKEDSDEGKAEKGSSFPEW